MDADREKWDLKHGQNPERGTVLPVVVQAAKLAGAGGRALDLACGRGRHSLYLLEAGFDVHAVDISPVGLAQIPEHERLHKQCADLDDFSIEPGAYRLILAAYFLDRRLFGAMREGLAPGGVLVVETFLQGSDAVNNAAFKLRPGELAEVFADLDLMLDREVDGIASFIARRLG